MHVSKYYNILTFITHINTYISKKSLSIILLPCGYKVMNYIKRSVESGRVGSLPWQNEVVNQTSIGTILKCNEDHSQ